MSIKIHPAIKKIVELKCRFLDELDAAEEWLATQMENNHREFVDLNEILERDRNSNSEREAKYIQAENNYNKAIDKEVRSIINNSKEKPDLSIKIYKAIFINGHDKMKVGFPYYIVTKDNDVDIYNDPEFSSYNNSEVPFDSNHWMIDNAIRLF